MSETSSDDMPAGVGADGTQVAASQEESAEAPLPVVAASAAVEPLPPGGRSDVAPLVARGALPAVPGGPPVTTSVPVPAEPFGIDVPGVRLAQRPRRRGDSFGWPANAAPGKPEGEVDTRPRPTF